MKKTILAFSVLIPVLAFSQPKAELTESEKLFGLSTLWSNAKFYFANFDISKINWDSTYQAFIPKVIGAKTVRAYYDTITKFYALLKDGHSNVYLPDSLRAGLGRLPVSTKLIENKVIITGIYNDTLKAEKIDVGDEILEINGTDAVEYGKKYVMPYQSSSTQQDRIKRTYSYYLLVGGINEPVHLKLKKQDGPVILVSLSRKMRSTNKWEPYTFMVTPQNIGILTVKSFELDNYDHLFDSIYPALLKTKALIIDVRENGGGSTDQGTYIMSHLIDKPIYGSKWRTQQYTAAMVSWGIGPGWYSQDADKIQPADGPKYLNPVVVLTSALTFSAAEDFMVEYVNSKRGIKIGQTTAGSTGNPYAFNLPGGGKARICTKRDTYPDGKDFVGVGIAPDIEVNETIKSIRNQTDLVLNKAIDYLGQKIK